MYYGYLFALGLLSSTLLGAILTSHFNYQVRGNHQVKQLLLHLYYAKSVYTICTLFHKSFCTSLLSPVPPTSPLFPMPPLFPLYFMSPLHPKSPYSLCSLCLPKSPLYAA